MKGIYSGHKTESTHGISRVHRVPERKGSNGMSANPLGGGGLKVTEHWLHPAVNKQRCLFAAPTEDEAPVLQTGGPRLLSRPKGPLGRCRASVPVRLYASFPDESGEQ